MKAKILLFTMILCFISTIAMAGTGIISVKTKIKENPSPVLHTSETLVDFGKLVEGPVIRKTITISNTGTEVLDIKNVTTS